MLLLFKKNKLAANLDYSKLFSRFTLNYV